MIRTIITPHTTQITLSIPKEYVYKKVEVMLYAIAEVQTPPSVYSAYV